MTHSQVVYSISTALWTSLAFLNARLAESKSDRPFKWFMLSLWLGPLASLLILARPVVDRPPDENVKRIIP